jgi:hypothetical protein
MSVHEAGQLRLPLLFPMSPAPHAVRLIALEGQRGKTSGSMLKQASAGADDIGHRHSRMQPLAKQPTHEPS